MLIKVHAVIFFLVCSINLFSQTADKIYFDSNLIIGQIIPPFNVLSQVIEVSLVNGKSIQYQTTEIDSIHRDGLWYFNLSSLDPLYEGEIKLAKRIFQGEYSFYKNANWLGETQFYLLLQSHVIHLTESNFPEILSNQFGSSAYIPSALTEKDLIKSSISSHKNQNLKVKDYKFEQKAKPIAVGLAISRVSSNLSGATLVTDYDASLRYRAFVNFKLKRSQISLGYTVGQIKFSIAQTTTNNGLYQIDEGIIQVNGGSVHYDYFLSKKKIAPFLRPGIILTKPEVAEDERYFSFNYTSTSYLFFGAGLRVLAKPEINLQYNYRSKKGNYWYSADNEIFKEINHSFGLEISF